MLLALTLALCAAPPTLTDAHGDPLPPGALFRLGSTRFRLGAESSDGVCVASCGKNVVAFAGGVLRTFDGDGRLQRTIGVRGRSRRTAPDPADLSIREALSADGRFAAVAEDASDEGERRTLIRVFDAATGRGVRAIVREKEVDWVTLSPDGNYVATVSRDEVRVTAVSTGKDVVTAATRSFGTTAFSADGKRFALIDADDARFWETATGKPLPPRKFPARKLPAPVQDVEFLPGGSRLAFLDGSGPCVFDIVTGKTTRVAPPPAKGPTSRFSDITTLACGKYLAAITTRREVLLWDATTLSFHGGFAMDHDCAAVTFAADGVTLLAIGANVIRRWDTATKKEIAATGEPSGSVYHVALAGGTALALHDGTVAVWNVSTGKVRFRVPSEDGSRQVCDLSPDGNVVACVRCGAKGGSLRRIDAVTGKVVSEHPYPKGFFREDARTAEGIAWLTWFVGGDVSCLATHLRLATIRGDRLSLDVAPLADGHPYHFFTEDGRQTRYTAAVAPGGRFFVSCDYNPYDSAHYVARVHETSTGRQVGRATMRSKNVTGLALSPDGRTLLAGHFLANDGTSPNGVGHRLIDTRTGRTLFASDDSGHQPGAVCFSPRGEWYAVASNGDNGRVVVYETATGKIRGEVESPAEVTSLAPSPDGRRLLVGMGDGTAVGYPVP